jgi:sugar lactone lactonase YvrE
MIRNILSLILGAALALSLQAGQPVINTLAGYSGQGYADGAAEAARFFQPLGVAADRAGDLFIADTANHTIRKLTADGRVSTLAGLAGVSGSVDGTADAARFNQPQGIAVDTGGNVYVGDTGNNTIRKINPAGMVSTLAGLAGVAGSSNGIGSGALFSQPAGVALDSSTNLYVADYGNSTLRKITPAGSVSTLAGSPGDVGTNNGTGAGAQFYLPQGVAVDGSGNIYVADSANHAIRKVTSGGSVTTLAGSLGNFGTNNGTGANAQFDEPAGVAVDTNGNVYVADTLNHTVRKVTPTGAVSTIAGAAGMFGANDGTNTAARFNQPSGLVVGAGALFVADSGNGTLRKINATGPNWVTTTVAGSPSIGSADGAGSASRFFWPAALACDTSNNVYIADAQNATIRKINPSGQVSTLAGVAGSYCSADGSGTGARFFVPQGIAVDRSGNVYVADTGNNTVRAITPGGTVSTLAGSPGSSGIADGTGGGAQFNQPTGIGVDSNGNVYVADAWNQTIRKITSDGVVTTLAGVAGSAGSVDGTNSAARFNWPAGVAVDAAGNIYVADSFNHAIRLVTSSGAVTTLAGLLGVWGNADGTNSGARFCRPAGLALDGAGNIYVADTGNQTLREISPIGSDWVVTTVAGLAAESGSLDRLAGSAQFNYPSAVALDSAGYIYVADSGNNAIRVNKLLPATLTLSSAANQAVLSWPLSGPGFLVEHSSSVGPSATWGVVSDSVSVYGQNYVVTNGMTAPLSFYRLHKP